MSSFNSFRVERNRVSVFDKAVTVGAPEEIERAAELARAREAAARAAAENPSSVQDTRVESALEQVQSLREAALAERENAEAEANRIIEQARAEAERIRADARIEGQRICAEERERGYSEGMRQAYSDNAARKKQEAAELEKMMTDIRRERVEVIESLRGEII